MLQVTRLEWATGLSRVTGLVHLPWLTLCDRLADVDEYGRIHYPSFLDKYDNSAHPDAVATPPAYFPPSLLR